MKNKLTQLLNLIMPPHTHTHTNTPEETSRVWIHGSRLSVYVPYYTQLKHTHTHTQTLTYSLSVGNVLFVCVCMYACVCVCEWVSEWVSEWFDNWYIDISLLYKHSNGGLRFCVSGDWRFTEVVFVIKFSRASGDILFILRYLFQLTWH